MGRARLGGAQRAELIRAAQHLLSGIHQSARKALPSAVFTHRDTLDVAAAQRGIPVEQASLHHRGVRDQRAVVEDQRVHAAERMLPVGVGELSGERVDDHSACVLAGLVVEVGGVNQAGAVDARKRVLTHVSGTGAVRVHTAVSTSEPPLCEQLLRPLGSV